MITTEQKQIINLFNYEETEDAIERLEGEFKRINSEEYFLDKIKELQKNGSVWFKTELKNINNKMSLAEAKRINNLMLNHALHDVVPIENKEALKGISLYDMLEAKNIYSSQPDKITKNPDGSKSRTMFMRIDERLIAALYIANNYDGGTFENPDLVAFSDNTFVLVVKNQECKLKKEETN